MKKQKKTEFLYGIHPLMEALKAGRRNFQEIYVSREASTAKRIFPIITLAEKMNIPVKEITADKLKFKSGSAGHQGAGALVSTYPYTNTNDITASINSKSFLLIADSIQDPQNLGALIRTALCAGADSVIIPKNRATPPTPSVSNASAGALEHMPVACVTNIVNFIKKIRQKGIWVMGTDISSKTSVFSSDLTVPLAVVIGGEGRGIRPLVKKNCDLAISIPQSSAIGSLNASAAGAVVMYEVLRQRSQVKA